MLLVVWTIFLYLTSVLVGGAVPDGANRCGTLNTFVCGPALCINQTQACNGVSECLDGRDESIEICGCQSGEFQCNSTVCISELDRCNALRDCENGDDEQGCETYPCPPSHIKCRNHVCVSRDLQCDFKDDCGDNSDEEHCDYPRCSPSEWTCQNAQCIPPSQLCDGHKDCYDNSDELNCEQHFRCANGLYVSKDHRCDGWVDCVSSQCDELHCRECNQTNDLLCPNGRCLPLSHRCDGVCDCESCTDEHACAHVPCMEAGRFICGEVYGQPPAQRRCIQTQFVCDGHNDCRDQGIGTDEEECFFTPLTCRSNATYLCPEGKCLPLEHVCNHVRDCRDGQDEHACSFPECKLSSEFRCQSGECIDKSKRCDGGLDCADLSDETTCVPHQCPRDTHKCERSGQCIDQEKVCDFRRDCLDGSEEEHCDIAASCGKTQFQCRSGQCIPNSEVCVSGKTSRGQDIGCQDGSHLLNCMDFECGEDLFKCRRSYCIDPSLICDHKPDCMPAYDDELICRFPCPDPENSCMCLDLEMDCQGLHLTQVPDTTYDPHYQKYLLGNNNVSVTLDDSTFLGRTRITYLDLSSNGISHIGNNYFAPLWRLVTLNLQNNNIKSLGNFTFKAQQKCTSLYLQGNNIQDISDRAFIGLHSLNTLDLCCQDLAKLRGNTFLGLPNLHYLNISHNYITVIEDGAFNGLVRLQVLDISENKISITGRYIFHGLSSLHTLKTDEYRWCCLAVGVADCLPKPDEFSSCKDLMSNHVLRISIWVLGTISLLGNTVVVAWRIRDTRDSKVHSFLITNLAIGDMMMGVYLLIIAAMDLRYRGDYIIHDLLWRGSGLCRFAGFLSTYSSELSVFTLTVITIDRFISIIFPFRIKRLRMREARIVMASLWILVFLLAAMPLVSVPYFRDFYGRSGVCLALHITPEKPPGWEYSVFVFLGINSFSFMVIFGSYMWMFLVARRTRVAARSPQMKTERAMARRMTLIVLTDFCCWVPIIGLGIASLSGSPIPPQVFAWIAVFVLPLNSAINPILYTLSTASFLGPARKKAFKFRQSFMSSFAATLESKTTAISEEKYSPSVELVGCSGRSARKSKLYQDHMCMHPLGSKEKKPTNRQNKTRREASSVEYTRTDTLCGYDSDQMMG